MFLQTVFLEEGYAIPQEKAVWDTKKGKTRMAPFVGRNVGGVITSREGYDTKSITFTNIAPERPVTMDDVAGRMFGENFVSDMTPEQRAMMLMAEDLMEMRQEIASRKEWMVSQILFGGKFDLLEYVDGGLLKKSLDYVDFGFTQEYTPDVPWGDTGSNIIADMEAMAKMVREGQGSVEIIIMASDVKAAMYLDEAYLKILDNRRFNSGLIAPAFAGQSLLYIGVNHLGTPMYEYDGTVIDHNGNVVKLVPDGKMLMGGKKLLKSVYGPVTQIEVPNGPMRTYLEREVPLRYSETGGTAIKQRLTSRPIVMPFNVDGWVVGDVL